MAGRTQKTKVNTTEIDQALGKFAVANYNESIYPSLYHAIREVMGLKAKYALELEEQKFDWKEFNEVFKEALGDPKDIENRRYTLEQLIEYGQLKTGHSVEQLLEINRRSWQRRKEWQKKKEDEQAINDEF